MNRTRLLTSTVTIVAAIGAVGLTVWNEVEDDPVPAVVQTGDAVAAPIPVSAPATVEAEAPPTTDPVTLVAPLLPADRATAPALEAPGTGLAKRMKAIREGSAPTGTGETGVKRNAFGVPCGIALSGRAMEPAMISLTLTAPCRPDTKLSVIHGDLAFTGRTNSLGTYQIRLPALSDPAAVVLRFADGVEEELELPVPDLGNFTRVGLQWRGDAGLGLHAFEFGASYGEPGHVWTGAPRGPEFAASGRGGFVMRLGENGPDAQSAEIYTYPQGAGTDDGVVRLNIEAEVTEANCGDEVTGHSLQPDVDGRMVRVDLTLAIPGCDAIGEFLVLKNVLRDLRIAAK